MPRYHHWTSPSQKPFTEGNQAIHDEIAASQVFHWTPKMIVEAEKNGYFEDLTRRAMKNTRLGLLADIAGDEE